MSTEQYTCICLNVQITPSPPPSDPPQYPRDPNYFPVFIKDTGISVTHPQATVRVPLKSERVPGTSRYSRFTLLTCLFCSLPVYRVYNTISRDVEGAEATLLPSEDWVESEIMKSSTGWIDVHKDSLRGAKIVEVQKAPTYMPPFSLSLPPTCPFSPPALEAATEPITPPISPLPEAPPKEYLSDLRPLFLPPPFTPSHPIFVHLAALASTQSSELRAESERRIADFVKAEIAGLQAKEAALKQQVEALWNGFRHNVEEVQRERPHVISNIARSLSRPNPSTAPHTHPSSSVTIRDFSPQRVDPPQRPVSASAPRVSALSASLATTKFYHPKEVQERPSSQRITSNEIGSPPQPQSSSLLIPVRSDVHSILQFTGKNDDTINTQASYRYFVTLDEDMARYKAAQKQESDEATLPGTSAQPDRVNKAPPPSDTPKTQSSSTSRTREKSRKKVVTFVEPPPVDRKPDDEDDGMMFDFEVSDQPGSQNEQAQLPLLEQPVPRPRPQMPRARSVKAHEAFMALRPASLPAPSHIRPVRSQPGVDSFSQRIVLNLPRSVNHSESVEVQRLPLSASNGVGLQKSATDTPNQHKPRTPETKSWREYARRRQNSKDSSEYSFIPEEGANDAEGGESNGVGIISTKHHDDTVGLPASVPINIMNRIKPREGLSLASYKPPAALPEDAAKEPVEPVGPGNKPLSSTSIRKALYTERDRTRAMDPGPLDFAIEEDEEEEGSDNSEHEQIPVHEAGEQGRLNALRIIQARDELPAEGMWRSLA